MKHRSKHKHRHHHRHHPRHRKHDVRHGKLRRHRLHLLAPPTPQTLLTEAMVDRLFWRAGFGPSEQDRTTLDRQAAVLGRSLAAQSTPAGYQRAAREPTRATRLTRRAMTPTWCSAGSTGWSGRRIPFVERHHVLLAPPLGELARAGVPAAAADDAEQPVPQATRISARNPKANFRQMAYAVTIDPSMLRYLTGELNVKGRAERELRA